MDSSQQFRLHWKNHSPNFVNVFTQLFNSESLVDVTLAAEGKQIQAHRVVLSACSSYFKELFISHPCQHPIVLLKDVNFKDLCTVIHFMYYGEVNIEQGQINSILKTAETLHVKGFADKADRESLAAALLFNEDRPSTASPFSEPQVESDDAGSLPNSKRQRNESNESHSKSSLDQQVLSPELKRKFFQMSGDDTVSSFRSSCSFESSTVIKSQSSLAEQNSTEMDHDTYYNNPNGKQNSIKNLPANSGSACDGENGTPLVSPGNSSVVKSKRNRPLIRQDRVRKELDKDHQTQSENERCSPIVPNFQPILPKSAVEVTDLKSPVQTYRQLAPSSQLMNKRSQAILPSPSGTYLPISACTPTTSQSLSILSSNIPTLAVTPVSSTPNIVIDQYPTILRVVSFDEMNVHTELQTTQTPTLARMPSQSGSSTSNTLQVPTIIECLPEPSSRGLGQLKVRVEENLRRSVSNLGILPSSTGSTSHSTGHCPVLRTGAALGCNYCWNTVDDRGRILRRKTKYHCPDCQANLCIVPCFQDYHEKFVSANEGKSTGSRSKGPAHQLLPKMSSI